MKKGICVLLLVFVLGYYVLGDEVPTEHISNAFKEMDGDGDEKLTLKEVSLLIIIKRDLAWRMPLMEQEVITRSEAPATYY